MLTKESQELEHYREELFFYSNQCLSEVRRVGQDNGLLLTDHFITMSQIQCAYINQHHVMWADFLSHFSEIGLVNDGAPETAMQSVAKQKPATSQPTGQEEEKKDREPAQVNGTVQNAPAETGAVAAQSATNNFLDDVRDADEKEDESPMYSRRISRLDNVGKFAASLDAVRVDKSAQGNASNIESKSSNRAASLVAAQASADPNLVREEDEGFGSDSDYGVESDPA